MNPVQKVFLITVASLLTACGQTVTDVVDASDVPIDSISDIARQDTGQDAIDDIESIDAVQKPEIDAEIDSDTDTFTRPEKGDPVANETIAEVTDLYLEILEKTRYFEVLNERVHGWPRTDPAEGYWYGTWWSGITMTNVDGRVTYLHSTDGADNNGMRTAPMLVGTSFALKLWGNSDHLGLLRRLVRGFNSWAMVFRSPSYPGWEDTCVLSRASYPISVESAEGDRDLYIDYSLNHPGDDNDACKYVEIADNPFWGHIFAKNRRSKDDIGHMMIALAMLGNFVVNQDEIDPEAEGLTEDINEAMDLYRAWAAQVDNDDWKIATVDKEGSLYYPIDDLGFLWLEGANIECEAAVTLRLFHGGDPDDLNCGNGINEFGFGEEDALKNDFHQIQRSFHESAIMHAWLAERNDIANQLLDGLAWRVDVRLDELESLEPPQDPHYSDLGELVLMSGNAGLPLTWREIRFLHERIREAHNALAGDRTQAELDARYNVFSPEVPDGTYAFDPGDTGLAWRYLGAVLGACASPFWNKASKQLLDCKKIRDGFN